MVMEGDLTQDGEHTTQYIDDALQNCTPETYIMLLTNVTPQNSIKWVCYLDTQEQWRGIT